MGRLTIPESGLQRVLKAYSGMGQLLTSLAVIDAADVNEWNSDDVRRRALRVVLAAVEESLERWPARMRTWQDSLPNLSRTQRFWNPVPAPRVDWAKTVQRGVPPVEFRIRRRHRGVDDRALGALAWTLEYLAEAQLATSRLLAEEAAVGESLGPVATERLAVALNVGSLLPEAVNLGVPTLDDINALRSEGEPWRSVADTAKVLIRLHRTGGAAFAATLLAPSDDFRDRLFQLGVLGVILESAEAAGATITAKGPIALGFHGPNYVVRGADGRDWDLWFEASGCWSAYSINTPYEPLARGLRHLNGIEYAPLPLRPDILMASAPDHAVSFECKYPKDTVNAGYVAGGLPQASFYAQQLAPAFRRVESYVVGPEELVGRTTQRRVRGLRLGFMDSSGVDAMVQPLMQRRQPISAAGRSTIMRSIRRRDTRPELLLRGRLHALGLRYRTDLRIDLGAVIVRPDVVFTRAKLAVFVDGCFWHRCPIHGRQPRENSSYWSPKLDRNVERDAAQQAALEEAGWVVLRFWEHEAAESAAATVESTYRALPT